MTHRTPKWPLLWLVVSLSACGAALPEDPPEMGLSVVAPTVTSLNAGLIGKAIIAAAPQTLRIHRSSLDQPLLYIAAVMETSEPDSEYNPYQPRLVTFSKKGDSLILSDIRPHQRYTETATLPRIIAQFPIMDEDQSGYTFNFAEGMRDTFTVEGRYSKKQSRMNLETPPHSYISQSFTAAGSLTVDHHFTAMRDDVPHTVVMRHIFKRDRRGAFEPREADTTHSFGFFTTPPQYRKGSDAPYYFIARWDTTRPIQVALSPNIPSPIQPAIRDAIQNWNTVLGKDVLVVSNVPASRGPLDLRHDIVINWVTNDSDATAVGYMMNHPETGEILHGDVMLTSARLLYISRYAKKTAKKLTSPPPEGFALAEVCRDVPPQSEPMEAVQEAITHRMIQQVTTHELGHVLGLRHNFAGNSGGTLTPEVKKALLHHLAEGPGDTQTPLPSASIMDYLVNSDRLMMTRPGPYDEAAIRWAYLSPANAAPASEWRFCTDEDTNDYELNLNNGTMADCQRFDYGTDPLFATADSLEEGISQYLTELLQLSQKSSLELNDVVLADLPKLSPIEEDLYRLHSYLLGQMKVWPIQGQPSIERILKASDFLEEIRHMTPVWDKLSQTTMAQLDWALRYGTKEEQLRAIDLQIRINAGLKRLQKLLDAPVGSLHKKKDGTAADSNHGD